MAISPVFCSVSFGDYAAAFLVFRSTSQDILTADDSTRFFAFWSGGQYLIAVCGDEYVVFDPHAADGIVFFKDRGIDVFCVVWGFEVDLLQGVTGEVSRFEGLISGMFLLSYPICLRVWPCFVRTDWYLWLQS